MRRRIRWVLPCLVVVVAIAAAMTAASSHANPPAGGATATPIKHLVVIFQENVSFDHYFGTYPEAANTRRHPVRAPRPGTPAVNGPQRLAARGQPEQRAESTAARAARGIPEASCTCDQDHNYSDEQQAFDDGKMDQFVQSVGTDGGTHAPAPTAARSATRRPSWTTTTATPSPALWNYAQHYAMSDNSFGTTFGPSAPGAINLASGDTGGVDTAHEANSPSIATSTAPDADITPDGTGGFSLTSDAQPYWDDCSTRDAVALKGQNIGDELNAARPLLGLVPGRLRSDDDVRAAPRSATGHAGQPTATFIPDEFSGTFTGKVVPTGASNQALCDAVHPSASRSGETADVATTIYGFKDDYIAHHEPFQYYASTANPHHLSSRRTAWTRSRLDIGTDTQSFVARRAAVRHAEPQLRHERLRPARGGDHGRPAARVGAPGRHASSRRRATRTAMPPTPTRPTSSSSSCARSTRSSSRPTGRARP